MYIWTRSKIMYTDNTTIYTTAVCDSSWEAVNDLQIGGRNLLLNTADLTKWHREGNVTVIKDSNGYFKVSTTNTSSWWSTYWYITSATAGQTYTLSGYSKKGTKVGHVVVRYYKSGANNILLQKDVSEGYFTIKFTVPSGAETITVYLGLSPTASGDYTYFKLPKLELGDKATDWTPAPEDVNSAIGLNVSAVDIYYYLSTSATGLAGGSWNTKAPTWVNGKYIWQKTVTTLANGIKTETTPVCITGANNTAIQSNTEPVDKTLMWLDTSAEPPILKRWNGTAWVVVNDITNTINLLEQRFTADISTSEKNIKQTLTESYYTKDATDSLVSSVSSSWEHTAKGFEMQFDNISKNLGDVSNNADTRFQEISKYIRFVDGNIVLGEAGSELILKIANDRISFLQNNTEVAYFSNRKLYVTDGEYTNSLQLGKFAFIPRSNGNLSFKKIVD